ncbi:MAG: sigma-70 family RNA polymerase sigma factor [Cyclobacteriaceae bacterium]
MAKGTNRLLNTISTYGKNLMGFISNRVSSQEEAEDILQEVWYQLSRIVNLDEIENINAWLHRVARNKITDSYRKKKPEPTEDGDDEFSLLVHQELPDDELFRELFWEELFRTLDELPPKQRDVFVQNELEDRTLQEIADQSDESIKTIISRKRYAVQHLRNQLQQFYDDLNNF